MDCFTPLTTASCIRRQSHALDADEHAQNLSQWDQRYDQLSAGRFEGSVMELWLPQTQVFVERANRQLRQTCAAWKDSIWFGIPDAEDGKIWMGSKQLAANAVCVRDGGQEFDLMTAPDFDLFGIVVNRRAFADYLDLTARQDLDQLLHERDVIALAAARKNRLCAVLNNILCDAELSQDSPNILQSRIFELLAGLLHEGEQALPSSRRSTLARQQVIARLRELVLAHPAEPLAIPALCSALHVSRRTLQNCVEEVTGMSPLSYIRSLRLNEVRRRLQREPETPISNIAYSWGFTHLSQFAQDYRQHFGTLPSEARKA